MAQAGTGLSVRVQPKASRDQLLGFRGAVLQVKVTAPPERGKANAALIKLLSGRLELPRGNIRILSGHTSRDKRLAVDGLSFEELEIRIRNERRVEL